MNQMFQGLYKSCPCLLKFNFAIFYIVPYLLSLALYLPEIGLNTALSHFPISDSVVYITEIKSLTYSHEFNPFLCRFLLFFHS